ncbi:MAG: hypothetical protein E7409_00515 [Ruminococcaceae bacterium]|nr:hypothetical protein [Oscillospiraceae bacterium]
MKKTIACLLSFLLLCSMLVVMPVSADIPDAGPLRLSLRMDKEKFTIGDTLTLSVNFDFQSNQLEKGGAYIVTGEFRYDPELLEAVHKDGTVTVGNGNIGTRGKITCGVPEPGVVKFIYGDASSKDITDDGTLFTMQFHVAETAYPSYGTIEWYEKGTQVITRNQNEQTNDYSSFVLSFLEWNYEVKPPYSYNVSTPVKLGESIVVKGKSDVSPLTVTLAGPDGVELESYEVEVEDGEFSLEIPVAEDAQTGNYKVAIAYGSMKPDVSVRVYAPDEELKPDPIPESKPDDGDDEDDKPAGGAFSDNKTNTGAQGSLGNTTTKPESNQNNEQKEPEKQPVVTEPVVKEPVVTEPVAPSVTYPNDIDSHWANEYVKYAFDQSLMSGYEDGSFKPDGNITRAEFATVMCRYLGLTPAEESAFADTDGHWAAGYVAALSAAGIVSGTGEDSFSPDAFTTRQEIAIILTRAFSLSAPETIEAFNDDADIADWAKNGVYAVQEAGYMMGSDGAFSPVANATRAEIATIFTRLHKNGVSAQ